MRSLGWMDWDIFKTLKRVEEISVARFWTVGNREVIVSLVWPTVSNAIVEPSGCELKLSAFFVSFLIPSSHHSHIYFIPFPITINPRKTAFSLSSPTWFPSDSFHDIHSRQRKKENRVGGSQEKVRVLIVNNFPVQVMYLKNFEYLKGFILWYEQVCRHQTKKKPLNFLHPAITIVRFLQYGEWNYRIINFRFWHEIRYYKKRKTNEWTISFKLRLSVCHKSEALRLLSQLLVTNHKSKSYWCRVWQPLAIICSPPIHPTLQVTQLQLAGYRITSHRFPFYWKKCVWVKWRAGGEYESEKVRQQSNGS